MGTRSPAEPARAAVIDIGSHATRLIVGERQGESLRVLDLLRMPASTGNDVFRTGTVSPAVTGQLLATLERFRQVLQEYGTETVKVVATTAVREARNRDLLLDTIRRHTGFEATVLTAGDVVYYFDAYLFFRMSRTSPVRSQVILTAELGSGSADFSTLRRGAVLATAGLPMGMLRLARLAERVGGGPESASMVVREYVETELAGLRRQLPRIGLQNIVLFSESLPSALNAVLGTGRQESGLVRLTRRRAEDFWQRCRARSAEELAETHRLSADTAATLEATATTVAALLKVFEKNELFVVQTSLGEALLTYLLFDLGRAERYNKLKQQLSAARSLCHRHGVNIGHSRRVARFARRLFEGLAGHIGLEPGDLNYLLLAAYLHDIGKFVSASAHHKHSEYLISALNLFRLNDEEVRLIACVARYHRHATPRDAHPLYRSLPPRQRMKVQRLAALLRLADALDRSHTNRVRDVRARVTDDGAAEVRVQAAAEPLLERLAFEEKKDLFCEIAGCDVRLVVEAGNR